MSKRPESSKQEPRAKKRPRCNTKSVRIKLPRPPDVSEDDMLFWKWAKKMVDKAEGESSESDSVDQHTQSELSVLRWLKQESDDPELLDVQEETWVKLPEDREKLYDWLRRNVIGKQQGSIRSAS